MRIVHVMECFVGGARRHLVDLSTELVRRGHEVHAILSLERDAEARAVARGLVERGVTVHELSMDRAVRPWRDARARARLEGLLRALDAQCVHTHGSKAGVLGRLAARRLRIPVHHTPHGFAFEKRAEFGPLRRFLFRAVERRLARVTRGLVALSERERRTAIEVVRIPVERTHLVPNGIPWPEGNSPACREEARRRLSVDPRALVLFHAGPLMPEKGQRDLLAALARSESPWSLWIAGEGPARAELERDVSRLGLEGRVHLLGWRSDVPTWIDACDLALMSSRSEAAPYFALEVLSRGRPLLATRVSGLEELVRDGENGWLVEPGDVPALAERLEQAARDLPALAAFRDRARSSLRDVHRLDVMVDAHERLYANAEETAAR